MKTKALVGQVFEAGTVLAILEKRWGKTFVSIRCSKCPQVKSVLYSDIVKERQVSCGCHGKSLFKARYECEVALMDQNLCAAIFEVAEVSGKKVTAAQFGVSEYIASFVWRAACERLAQLPDDFRAAVYDWSQLCAWDQVAKRFDLTKSTARRICLQWHKEMIAIARDLDASRGLEQTAAEWSEGLLEDVQFMVDLAVQIKNSDSYDRGTYAGEFNRMELSTNASRLGWVRDTLQTIRPAHVTALFGEIGLEFLEACARTEAGRRQRKREYLVKLKDGQVKPKSRVRQRTPVDSYSTYWPFKKPRLLISTMASLLSLRFYSTAVA